jgi:heme/copper-type cytochrome/quinol oxidase subunit 4
MKRLKSVRRKILATFVFSILASIGAIIHGIFLDLDINQIQRLSLEGFLVTFLVVFPSLLLLEWIFDLENHEEFKIVEKRISELEKKK